jgi:hypothetical protein
MCLLSSHFHFLVLALLTLLYLLLSLHPALSPEVEVTLRLMVGRSVSQYVLVSGTPLGPVTRIYFFHSSVGKLPCSSSWGALSKSNHTEHTDTVRTSQETHHVSATEPNRLMLFGETVAVYCDNHTEHSDTVRTSQHQSWPLHWSLVTSE